MKKLFTKLIGYLCAILATLLVAFFAMQTIAPVTGGLIGSIRIKNQILQTTPSPRIIIAAGSSAPYCFISDEIIDAFNMPCVNMGATAYLGAKFYLSAIEPEIKQGDIIILAFEFNIYDGSYSGEIVCNAVENNWSLIKKLPLSYIPKVCTGYFPYALDKISIHLTQPEKIETDQQFYDSFGFSKTGDITAHRELILEKGYNTKDLHNINEKSLDKNLAKSIKAFAKKAEKKGAKVYISPSPINSLSLMENTDIDAFQRRISDETGVEILGSLQNGVMESKYFYDSNFHLNSEGAKVFTNRFIDELNLALNN